MSDGTNDEKKPYQHKYKLTYDVTPHPEGRTREEIEAAGEGERGSCDALALISMIFPPDGSLSVAIFGEDGRTGGKLSAHDMFKAWLMMCQWLAGHPELSEGKRHLCRMTFEAFWDAVDRSRKVEKIPGPEERH